MNIKKLRKKLAKYKNALDISTILIGEDVLTLGQIATLANGLKILKKIIVLEAILNVDWANLEPETGLFAFDRFGCFFKLDYTYITTHSFEKGIVFNNIDTAPWEYYIPKTVWEALQ